MPIYVYQCPNCGEVFERLVKMAAADEQHCLECGEKADRKIAGGKFVLKGEGWYRDGYQKKTEK